MSQFHTKNAAIQRGDAVCLGLGPVP